MQHTNENSDAWQQALPRGRQGLATTMNGFGKVIEDSRRLSTLRDVDEVLQGLSRLLKKTVRSGWAVVYLLDRERRDFAPARSCGMPPRYLPLFRDMPLVPEKIPLLRTILQKKHHLQIPNPESSRLLNPIFRRLLKSLALLAVPMVVHNQVTGAVFVARRRSVALTFTPDEIAVIKDMVSHAALVVSHIELFDQSLEMALDMAKRIDVILTLDEINKAISSSLSQERIIDTAIEQIERIMQCELVSVLEGDGGQLVVLATRSDVTPEELPALKRGAVIGKGNVAGQAFTHGESRYIPHLGVLKRLSALEKALRDVGIESLMAIPLISKEQPKGVLLLGDTARGQFVREDAFTIEKIAAQMAVALENARLYEEMRSLFINTVASLANAIDAKSPWTKGHSERVMNVATAIAREMGLPGTEVERIRLAGLLHDIGKIGIIEALLEKPEELSEDEFPPLRLHPEKGVAILAPIRQLQDVLPGVLHHHERFDGSGYPHGLKGESIPLAARVVAVADSFDAMVSDRPYKKGLSVREAIKELQRCVGSQFDRAVVEAFTAYLQRAMHGRM